jgi:hypothetical protein
VFKKEDCMKSALVKISVLSTTLLLVACATGPSITTQVKPNTNFSQYKTWGYTEQLGTDKAGYSTIITSEFKRAVHNEMAARGYVYTTVNPGLWVNFFSNVQNMTEVYSAPGVSIGMYGGYGGYGGGYGYGLGFGGPLYGNNVESRNYKLGTVTIDVVDVASKELIWEGVLEGALTKKAMQNPGAAIQSAVTQIYSKYPVQSLVPPAPPVTEVVK